MKVSILGCYAATPRALNNPTSQVLEINGHLFLIDCGEGTQVQLRKFKIKFARIKHVFISHLHGDHFFGLPGLISTFRLLGRESPLHIYGPKGIKEAVTLLLKLGDSWTNYDLCFHELTSTDSTLIFEDEKVSVRTLPLIHRIYTNGFLFKEKAHPKKLNVSMVEKLGISKAYYNNIKLGRDYNLEDGTVIPNEKLTLDAPKSRSYAYCSDTAYNEDLIPLLKGVDVLYHEATFLESENHLCQKTKHSTARQAACIAKKAEVGSLILGHYSTRYKGIECFRQEAKETFENTLLANDGKSFEF